MNGARLEAAGGSHVGCVRASNEDCYAALPALGLFVVADGMGGRPAGEIASRMAVDVVHGCLEENDPDETWPYAVDRTKDRDEARFILSVRRANQAIFEASSKDRALRGMGTTFAGVLVAGERAYLAHVGDSRVYRLRGGRLEPLTQDHSVAATTRRLGIPMEQVDARLRGLLLRAVGIGRDVEVETRVEGVKQGDVLLVCSDGLWGPVAEDEIATTLAWPARVEVLVAGLIGRALERGAPDNVSAVVARCGGR